MDPTVWLLATAMASSAPVIAPAPELPTQAERELVEAFSHIKSRHITVLENEVLLQGAREGMSSWLREDAGPIELPRASSPEARLIQDFRARIQLAGTDAAALKNAAITGMLRAINEPFTGYMEPRFAAAQRAAAGAFSGVGVQLEKVNDGFLIKKVFNLGPADLAGIKPEDTIMAIDRKVASEMSMAAAVTLLRGKPGSRIEVAVRSHATNALINLTLTRAPIHQDDVQYGVMEGQTGYIGFSTISESNGSAVVRHILGRMPQVSMIMLDLRGASGRITPHVAELASVFVSREALYTTVDREGRQKAYRNDGDQRVSDQSVVVLVDSATQGGPELLAAVLQSAGAFVAGQETAGIGKVQEEILLPSGGMFYLTTSTAWITPSQPLDGTGVTPDLECEDGLKFDILFERIQEALQARR